MWMTRMWVWVWMWVSFHSSQAQQVSPTHARTDRFLSMFSVVRFKNNECQAVSGDTGICYHSASCSSGGGEPSGECAQGFGSCCVTKLGCGGSTGNNGTYLESPNYPSDFNAATTCPYILHLTSDTCQVRLDVVEVVLALPTTQGNCVDDYLTFSQDIKWGRVCGVTTDSNFYLDVDPGVSTSLTLTFTTSAVSSGRRWKVKLSMITCDQLSLAPSGCGQYFTTTMGTIKGWNHDGIYLSNQNYAICIRKDVDSCSTTYLDNRDVIFRPFCDDTFEWPYNVNGLPATSFTCISTPAFIPSAPLTVSLQGPNYLYLVTTDSTNDHTDSTNINYSFTQNPC